MPRESATSRTPDLGGVESFFPPLAHKLRDMYASLSVVVAGMNKVAGEENVAVNMRPGYNEFAVAVLEDKLVHKDPQRPVTVSDVNRAVHALLYGEDY